jgi:hypothetical protein
MGFFTKKHDGLNTFVFNVDDYAELTYDQLIEVNGGCGSSGRGSVSYGRTGVTGPTPSGKIYSISNGACGGSSGSTTSSSRSSSSSSYGGCGGSNGAKSSTSNTVSSTNGACGGSASGSASSSSSTTVSSTYGACGGSYQIPNDPNDYHCDINSYNVAIDEGIKNPGTWDGNTSTVNEIYTENYQGKSTDKPQEGTKGYGFYDNDGDGSYDHMFFYDYTKGGDSYHVWNSDGISAPEESDWSINGTAADKSVFVPLT